MFQFYGGVQSFVFLIVPIIIGMIIHILIQINSLFECAFPPPKMRGLTIRRNSSIKPKFIKLDTRVAPPKVNMSLPGCCFILRPDLFNISDNLCCFPCNFVKGLGNDDMG